MTQREELPEQFSADLRDLETAYLGYADPHKRCRFHGGVARSRRERGIILEPVEGTRGFLDVGCAKGHLVQCLSQQAADGGVTLALYCVELGARLTALARRRLPQYASGLLVANP